MVGHVAGGRGQGGAEGWEGAPVKQQQHRQCREGRCRPQTPQRGVSGSLVHTQSNARSGMYDERSTLESFVHSRGILVAGRCGERGHPLSHD